MKIKENLIIIILLSSIIVVLSLILISINNNKDVGRYQIFYNGGFIIDTKTGDIYMTSKLGLDDSYNNEISVKTSIIENYKKIEEQRQKEKK